MLIAIALKQCKSLSENNTQPIESSISGEWHIDTIDTLLTSNLNTYVNIDLVNKKLTSSIGCNTHSCKVEVSNSTKIHITNCTTTEMYCAPANNYYEVKMIEALQNTTNYEIIPSKLLLKNAKGHTQLTLSK